MILDWLRVEITPRRARLVATLCADDLARLVAAGLRERGALPDTLAHLDAIDLASLATWATLDVSDTDATLDDDDDALSAARALVARVLPQLP